MVGVIPKALLDLGVGETTVTELMVTEGLRDRKAIMDTRGDAFVALPGGLGTLEEILEVMALKQLGYHRKPIAVLDLDGFYRAAVEPDPAGHRPRASSRRSISISGIRPRTWTRCSATSRRMLPHGYGAKWP